MNIFLDDDWTVTPAEYRLDTAEEDAERLGLQIVLPGPRELQVDLDGVGSLERFERQFGILQRNWHSVAALSMPTYVVAPSKSGPPNYHVTVTFPWALDPWERIAWQAALGSDPVRELLSCLRITAGSDTPTLFFEEVS